MARESIERRKDPGILNKWIPVGLVVFLWAVQALSTYLWLSANQFAIGWDRPKHLVSTLIFDRMLRPLNIVTLFEVFSLNIGYYPPLFPLSVVPLYRIFGVSADVAGMVNVVYMLILLLSLYGTGSSARSVLLLPGVPERVRSCHGNQRDPRRLGAARRPGMGLRPQLQGGGQSQPADA